MSDGNEPEDRTFGLTPERIAALEKELSYVYFVGMGVWSSDEAFRLGVEPSPQLYEKDLFSVDYLRIMKERMLRIAHRAGKLIFFMITREKYPIEITEKDACWLLDHRSHY